MSDVNVVQTPQDFRSSHRPPAPDLSGPSVPGISKGHDQKEWDSILKESGRALSKMDLLESGPETLHLLKSIPKSIQDSGMLKGLRPINIPSQQADVYANLRKLEVDLEKFTKFSSPNILKQVRSAVGDLLDAIEAVNKLDRGKPDPTKIAKHSAEFLKAFENLQSILLSVTTDAAKSSVRVRL